MDFLCWLENIAGVCTICCWCSSTLIGCYKCWGKTIMNWRKRKGFNVSSGSYLKTEKVYEPDILPGRYITKNETKSQTYVDIDFGIECGTCCLWSIGGPISIFCVAKDVYVTRKEKRRVDVVTSQPKSTREENDKY